MKRFERKELHGHLLAEYGIPRILSNTISDARSGRYIAYHALSCLSSAVEAALCNLDGEYEVLLSRAREWLDIALAEQEVPANHYGPNIHEVHCNKQLALTNWLLTNEIDGRLLDTACEFLRRYFQERQPLVEVAHNLPTFVIAQRFDAVRHIVDNDTRFKSPRALSGIKCPGKMSYLIAGHEAAGEPDLGSLRDAFQSFLKYQMPVCLHVRRNGLGTWGDVPTWMYLYTKYFDEPVGGPDAIRIALRYVECEP
jgi:hypothetical protein